MEHHGGMAPIWEEDKVSMPPKRTKYILFRRIAMGQGSGNIIHGLLAAHLLGEEFDRVVCVDPNYHVFHYAFQPIDSRSIADCPKVVTPPNPDVLNLVNYGSAPNECALKERLASDEETIVMVSNTYPRWRPVPDGYFKRFYEPTPDLKAMLPWTEPPKTVVHLRIGDNGLDKRAGTDRATLEALGKALPSDTYLVTNNLEWYDYFEREFQWKHPDWHAVQHSAANAFIWGRRGAQRLSQREKTHKVQHLQIWSDWYSMICAERVLHTASDFSLSAIHWMNIESNTILGVDGKGNLKLKEESWRTDPVVVPLKERGPDQLKNCEAKKTPPKAIRRTRMVK